MLNDVEFTSNILESYNMDIMDLFRFFFRMYPSIFKGLFIKKL